ncbi:hypothetical protein MD484_g9118, partial [Candolleomyces efflorescens]
MGVENNARWHQTQFGMPPPPVPAWFPHPFPDTLFAAVCDIDDDDDVGGGGHVGVLDIDANRLRLRGGGFEGSERFIDPAAEFAVQIKIDLSSASLHLI